MRANKHGTKEPAKQDSSSGSGDSVHGGERTGVFHLLSDAGIKYLDHKQLGEERVYLTYWLRIIFEGSQEGAKAETTEEHCCRLASPSQLSILSHTA